MRFKVDDTVIFTVMGTGAEPKARLRENKPVLIDGKPTYRHDCVVLREGGGVDRSVTVNSLSAEVLEAGKTYITAGDTYITPWVRNGSSFVNLSVTCEKFEESSRSSFVDVEGV